MLRKTAADRFTALRKKLLEAEQSVGDEIKKIADEMGRALGDDSGFGATMRIDFEGQGSIYIDGKSTPNTVTTNSSKSANCTLTISLGNFKLMLSGDLDGTTAFMQGKLKVVGDMSVAMKLGPILGSVRKHRGG